MLTRLLIIEVPDSRRRTNKRPEIQAIHLFVGEVLLLLFIFLPMLNDLGNKCAFIPMWYFSAQCGDKKFLLWNYAVERVWASHRASEFPGKATTLQQTARIAQPVLAPLWHWVPDFFLICPDEEGDYVFRGRRMGLICSSFSFKYSLYMFH